MHRLKKTVDMTEGPFFKKMILFAIPLIISGVLQSLYNAADLIVVGFFKGDVAVAAVGSTGSITNLTVGLFMGLSVGAGVAVAHHIGAKEPEEAKKVAHTSILLSLILGVVIGAAGFMLSETLLRLMGTPADVLPHSTLYMQIIFLGVPASMVYNYAASMIRSAGDSKRPMIFLAISGLVNVILNVILVALFDFGVDGVAIATIVSQYLSAIMSIVYLTKTSGPLRISLRKLRISGQKVKKILYIGIPSGIQSSLFSLSNVIIQSSINSFGDSVMAGSAASNNIEAIIYVAMNSIYHVALTFIGQNVGARKFKNIRRLTLYCAIIVIAVGLGCAAVFTIFRYPLLHMYVDSPEAISAAMERFLIIVPTYFLCGLMDVFCGGLRALDKSVTAMIISLAGACGLRILWIETIFRAAPSPISIYISYPVTWTVTAGCHLIFMIFAARKIIRNEHQRLELLNKENDNIGEKINEIT
ncbi:MAG: MATE family efflux transporter [Ruminococcaceae bacterium]|nr:MATE family efflux transporter [Oscillospiraceae bacterium]